MVLGGFPSNIEAGAPKERPMAAPVFHPARLDALLRISMRLAALGDIIEKKLSIFPMCVGEFSDSSGRLKQKGPTFG